MWTLSVLTATGVSLPPGPLSREREEIQRETWSGNRRGESGQKAEERGHEKGEGTGRREKKEDGETGRTGVKSRGDRSRRRKSGE